MKSTFYYKRHAKLTAGVDDDSIQADSVEFVPGFVVFYENVPIKQWPWTSRRIIQAVQAGACHDLREVLNDGDN